MAEALISALVEQLASIVDREIGQEVRLVVGVENAIDQLTSNLTAIKAVLADAETRQMKESTIGDWLEKLREVAYDIEDVLDDWEAAILGSQSKPERKVCSFFWSSCFCCQQVVLRHDIAKKIKELNERLDRIAQKKDRYQFVQREGNPPIERPMTTSFIDITAVKGRENDKRDLVNMLLSEPSGGDGSDLRVLSLVGMGGIGKTTLAQFAFNDVRVNDYFDEKIWVCVSYPFNQTMVANVILESLLGSTPDVTVLQSLLQKIEQFVEKRKIFLILDDVWVKDRREWDQLKESLRSASPESRVLVTTRNVETALVMGCSINDILNVGKLSEEECWSIVSKIAFLDRSDTESKNLEKIFAREMSKKCKGLPLAAKALGGILQFRKTREEWQSILSSDVWELDELEEAQEKVIAPLWLSYHDLSLPLKRCFSYCAIFPKDYVIEKRKLIELWMAQGYLKQRHSDDLEVIGENYFQNLTMRYVFQDFKKDEDDGGMIESCKMHDMVHYLAQSVGRNECLGVGVHGSVESIIRYLSSKVRHLSLDCTRSYISMPSFNSFVGTKKLRSLLIWELPLTTEELSRLFSESTHVRSLSLRDCNLAEIPPSICKLVKLRWLDLSDNRQLEQLPETLCELHSLQTIDVSRCYSLEKLPLGIEKLINLRHLHNYNGPERLPKGMGKLTGLRTLEEVDVGCDDDDDDAFSLGDLKNLNQLRGSLLISELGACHRHVGEAKQAELREKEHITQLGLFFTDSVRDELKEEEELLLEALEPSPNLENLAIIRYVGATFPGWMISLTNLRSIRLSWCQSCEHLPSLGKLPSLETLQLVEMSGVKKVGKEHFGIETQIGDSKSEVSASSSSSSYSPVSVAFPKLITLGFYDMPIWEKWDDYYNDNYDGTTKPPPIIMPSLHSLTIQHCRQLKALPDYILQITTLHKLCISGSCEHLPSLGMLPSLETLKLEGMWGVKKVGKELLGIETQIGDDKSEMSASSSSFVAFPELTTLEFHDMDNWEEWDDYYNDNYDATAKPPIIIMPSLRALEIEGCPRLKALPDYILQITALHRLEIYNCNLLEECYKDKTG